jgi:hypothetical protein
MRVKDGWYGLSLGDHYFHIWELFVDLPWLGLWAELN